VAAILILKTGALGDVLRTTALLPGLHARHEGARVTWVTAPGAVDLVRPHPQVAEVVPLAAGEEDDLEAVRARLGATAWDWVISLDDEEPLCRLAAALPARKLSGATWDAERGATYTDDTAPWFEMGLLSVHGKEEADRRKLANTRSHPEILADMLGVSFGKPLLPREPAAEAGAADFAAETGLAGEGPVIGLNTGAGGRWRSKMLPPERAIELALELDRRLEGRAAFLLLGGRDEAERNRGIAAALAGSVRLIDAGTDNDLLRFAALVSLCDLLVTSDSLALHVAVARDVRVVAFFAPTSAAEIELYGLGEKVTSSAPDYCSYRRDADTSTLTVERLSAAVLRQLPA
jgi:heptosyltransferase-2